MPGDTLHTRNSSRNQSLEFIDPLTRDENVQQQLQETRSVANKSEGFQHDGNRKVPPRRRSEIMKPKYTSSRDQVKIPFEGGGEFLLTNADQRQHKVNVGQDFSLSEEEDEEIAKKILFRHWPDKMAAYIYETGDEETVASTVENYLQLGILDREQALMYLQRIKTILDELHTQEMRNKKREEQQYYENFFINRKNGEDVDEEAVDLKDIRRLLQDLLLTALTDTLQDYSNPIDDHQINHQRTSLHSDKTAFEITHQAKKRNGQIIDTHKSPKNSIATSGIEDKR